MFSVDASCMVWGGKCGTNGNCWLYDGKRMKYYLNFTGASKYSDLDGLIHMEPTILIVVIVIIKYLSVINNDYATGH